MHELSIAMNIIDIAVDESRARGNAQVVSLHLRIGHLSGVVPHALLSAFELAREQTPLAHAELKIEEVPVKVYCSGCDCEQLVESIQSICCKVCGTLSANITQGRELEVVAMELEVNDVEATDSLETTP